MYGFGSVELRMAVITAWRVASSMAVSWSHGVEAMRHREVEEQGEEEEEEEEKGEKRRRKSGTEEVEEKRKGKGWKKRRKSQTVAVFQRKMPSRGWASVTAERHAR